MCVFIFEVFYMTVDQLKKKYQAEVQAYQKIGLYKRFSFLMRQSGDQSKVNKVLLEDNYSRTEIANTKSKFDYYNRKKQASNQVNAF